MTHECLAEYQRLIAQANELDKGKGKGSSGKAKKGDRKGKPGKPVQGPRQDAQQLKKQRFHKVLNDLAAKKAFFMSFLRHPCLMSADGIRKLLLDLREVMLTQDYKKMLLVSAKKTEEVALLKSKRELARKALHRGRQDSQQQADTELAQRFITGGLLEEFAAADAAYGSREQKGVAFLLPNYS